MVSSFLCSFFPFRAFTVSKLCLGSQKGLLGLASPQVSYIAAELPRKAMLTPNITVASWLFQTIVPPVLSFALGSLGFLTKFDYAGYPETLTNAFRDGITVSLRLRFEGTVMRAQKKAEDKELDLVEQLVGEESENDFTHKPEGTYEILNEIVVDRGPNPSRLARRSLFAVLTL